MATAHFITAPIRCRTRRAVSGLSCQIGVRIAKTSAVVTADTGSAPMRGNGIVKLTKSSSINPQDTGLQPVANPPCWASKTAISPNLSIPLRVFEGPKR